MNYRIENWEGLIELLQKPNNAYYFAAATRSQLLDDSFNLARAGQLTYTIPLDMSTYLMDRVEDYIPVKVRERYL